MKIIPIIILALIAINGCDTQKSKNASNSIPLQEKTADKSQPLKYTSQANPTQVPEPVRIALEKTGLSFSSLLATQSPFPKNMFLIPSTSLEKDWQSLAASLKDSGFWPVIVGDKDDLRVRSEMLEGRSHEDAHNEISLASQFNYAKWEKQAKSDVAPLGDDDEQIEDEYLIFDASEIELLATSPALKSAFPANKMETNYIAIIECKSPSHIPAILSLGEFNNCPSSDIHIALIQKLEKEAGAQLMSLTSDTVELHLTKLPKNQKTLAELSIINYLWASDVVSQGTESVPALAEAMQESETMFLWWD